MPQGVEDCKAGRPPCRGRRGRDGSVSLLNVPDLVYGDADNDDLRGAQAMLFGGQGDDDLALGTASFAESLGPVHIDLGTGKAVGEGEDELISISDVTGTKYDDEILGDGGNNRIDAGEGNDVIEAGSGTDVVDAGAGDDTCSEVEDATNCETTAAAGAVPGDTDGSDDGSSLGEWLGRNPVGLAITGGALLVILLTLAFRIGRRRVRRIESA